jgi:hypothetical protein
VCRCRALTRPRTRSRNKKWRDMGVASADPTLWESMMSRNREHVKERVRKGAPRAALPAPFRRASASPCLAPGIPNELRGLVWQKLLGSRDLRLRNGGEYARLLGGASSPWEVDIIRDLARTFPSHNRYRLRGGLGQQQLFRVLKAYSLYDPELGYTQSMNFLAAILLMYMSEEEAFWHLVAMLKGAGGGEPLEGLFLPGLPLVLQCQHCYVGLLASVAPKLSAHMEREGAMPDMYAQKWFLTLFSYDLPFDIVLRIWDIYMMEGMKVVYRVAVTLLRNQEDDLLRLALDELVPALKHAPTTGKASADHLIKTACELKVSKKLEALEAEWAAVLRGSNTTAPAAVAPPPPAARMLSRGDLWRRSSR